MKISLRKAHKLQCQLINLLNNLPTRTISYPVLSVSEINKRLQTESNTGETVETMFRQYVNEATLAKNQWIADKIQQEMLIVDLIYKIRNSINVANGTEFKPGLTIDAIMARKAEVEAKLKVLYNWKEPLPVNAPESEAVIDRAVKGLVVKWQGITEHLSRGLNPTGNVTIEFSATSCTELYRTYNSMYFELKNKQSEYVDELSYANNVLTIDLTDSELELVKWYQLQL